MQKILQEIWSDLNNKLQKDVSGDVKKEVNLDAVACAMENILLTRVGERVMRPDFGSLLQKYLQVLLVNMSALKTLLKVLKAFLTANMIIFLNQRSIWSVI